MRKHHRFEKILTQYFTLSKNWDDFPDKKKWCDSFESIYKKLLDILYTEEATPFEKRKSCNDLMYFFSGGMGRPTELVPRSLLTQSNEMFNELHNILRSLWAKEGNDVFTVDPSELFNVGDAVNMINGKLLSISFNGYKSYAEFVTRHRYLVISIEEKDISNMPQYVIKHDSHQVIARHDALVPSVT